MKVLTFDEYSCDAQADKDFYAGTELFDGDPNEAAHPLTKIGLASEFKGTVKSFFGISKSVEESQNVAAFAATVGIDLYRKDRSSMTRLLGALPLDAWIAASWPELKHSKHLPSECFKDSEQLTNELSYYAAIKLHQGRRFAVLTFPAMNELAPVKEFERVQKTAKEKARRVRELIEEYELGDASVIFERLEGVYRPETRKIFWHFHIIIEIKDEFEAVERLKSFLGCHSKILSNNWAAVSIEKIPNSKFERIAFYCAKPCRLAVQISDANHGEQLIDLFFTLKNRRMTTRWSGFRSMYRKLQSKGKRVAAQKDENGNKILTLAGKAKSEHQVSDEHISDGHSVTERILLEQESSIQKVSHDNFIEISPNLNKEALRFANRSTVGEKCVQVPTPEYIGIHGPIPGPGNRLYANIRVRNFSAEGIQKISATGCWWNIKEDQKALVDCWTTNTGEVYNLREFLAPFAQELWNLLKQSEAAPSNIYRTTITASPQILLVLEEILYEPKANPKRKKEHRKLPFWKNIKKVLVYCTFAAAAPLRASITATVRAVRSLLLKHVGS